MRNTAFCFVLLLAGLPHGMAADWPQYRGDAERSGYTDEKLSDELSLAWTYHPAHPPVAAWPRDDRMLFAVKFAMQRQRLPIGFGGFRKFALAT